MCCPLAELLFGLPQHCQEGGVRWQEFEPAMERLAELLAPEEDREAVTAAGDDWWLETGPVDLGEKLVTIQRGETLIAAIRPRPDGRLRVAAFSLYL